MLWQGEVILQQVLRMLGRISFPARENFRIERILIVFPLLGAPLLPLMLRCDLAVWSLRTKTADWRLHPGKSRPMALTHIFVVRPPRKQPWTESTRCHMRGKIVSLKSLPRRKLDRLLSARVDHVPSWPSALQPRLQPAKSAGYRSRRKYPLCRLTDSPEFLRKPLSLPQETHIPGRISHWVSIQPCKMDIP